MNEHEPLMNELANFVLASKGELDNETRDAVFSAVHELIERRFFPHYHDANVKTVVHWLTENTDQKLAAWNCRRLT